MVGSYTDKPSAEKTLNELKTKGYKDAKIITYTNGSKTGTTSNDNNQHVYDVYAPATDVSNLRVLTYVIQIGTFSNKKTADQLGNYNKYYINTLNDGKVQYFVCPYFRYDDAMNMYSSIKSKFSDAEVVAFNEGKTMTIANAKELEQASLKKNNDNNQTNTDELVYKVQVGAFSEKLSQEDINKKFGKLTSSYTLNTHTSDGMVKYSVGNTKSFEEAKKIRQNVVNLGFSDSFIIKFKNDKQVK
jgi:cell division protein FtsN